MADTTQSGQAIDQKPHVLFADDDEVAQGLLRVVTQRQDTFDAQIARGGREALEMWRRARAEGRSFAVIVLDGAMPDITGYRVAEEIRKVDPDVQIIFWTGCDDPISEWRAHGVGAAEFLDKNIDAAGLVEAVTSHLEH